MSPTRMRLIIDIVATFVCALSVALVVGNLSSPVRPYAVLLAAVIGSGWALSGWIRLPDEAAYVGTVTLGIGVAVPIAVGVILEEAGWWHPIGDTAVLIGVAGVLNLAQILRDARKTMAE